jgi:hypothetical protein
MDVLREWIYIFQASLKCYNEREWYIVAQDLILQRCIYNQYENLKLTRPRRLPVQARPSHYVNCNNLKWDKLWIDRG